MKDYKKINSVEMAEGEGAAVKRIFPTKNYNGHHDPVVLMDEFTVEAPAGFPMHEHRGFEALTYMLDGSFIHEDNLGNKAEMKKGGVQAFNAGKGLKHSEEPGEEGHSHGIQLWVNLPPAKKKSDPTYQQAAEIEEQNPKEGIKLREIIGPSSPIKMNTALHYLHLKMDDNRRFSYTIKPEYNTLVYLLEGELKINDEITLSKAQALLLEEDGEIIIEANQKSQLFIISGLPHHQKIKIKGSFVE